MTASTDVVVIPPTGEVVALDAPTDERAAAFAQVTGLEADLREAKAQLRDAIVARLDHENRRKAKVGPWHLEVDAPAQRDYEPDELAVVLAELVEAGKIGKVAMDEALKRDVRWKPAKREIAKLEAILAPEDWARVRACAHPVAKARSLKVQS